MGFIGYNIESLISDKYTPYSSECKDEESFSPSGTKQAFFLSESVQDTRMERLTADLDNAENVAKLQLRENVLERNLSPSLKAKQSSWLLVVDVYHVQ